MANNTAKTLAIATASALINLAAIEANPAQAAILTFDFTVDDLTGSLVGQTFNGSFSFDDTGFTGMGDEDFLLSDFDFNFIGGPYDETDDPAATAAFQNGVFLGVDFIGPNFDILDPDFTYDLGGGDQGTGSATYVQRTEPPTAVPEASSGLGLLAFGAYGIGLALKRNMTQKADSPDIMG